MTDKKELKRRADRQKSRAVRLREPAEPTTIVVAHDPWYLGWAAALAEIWRMHRDGQMVRHIMTSSGVTYKHLEQAGVDELDLSAIREACLRSRSEAHKAHDACLDDPSDIASADAEGAALTKAFNERTRGMECIDDAHGKVIR